MSSGQTPGKDSPPLPQVPAQHKVARWLTGCASTAPRLRECASPTRAPSGWSLSLSLSRAKRALEEEERSEVAPQPQAPAPAAIGAGADDLSDLEEGEVPLTPPPAPVDEDSDECQLKSIILEQQITSLRKTNAKLLLRLKDQDKLHTKTYSSVLEENVSLQKRLKEAIKLEKSRAEEIKELKEESRHLAQRLQKSKTKRKVADRDWNDKVDKLTAKVEFQKQNLAGLQSKLWKLTHSDSPPSSFVNEYAGSKSSHSVDGSSSEYSRQLRTRVQNQAEQLTNLNAALVRERQWAESLVAQLDVLGHKARPKSAAVATHGPPPAPLKHQAPSSWAPAETTPLKSGDDRAQEESFESSVLKVVTKAFPLALLVMKNYEELSVSMPFLRPQVKAAIAAMPPATRSLCLAQVKAVPAQLQASSDKEKGPDFPLGKHDSHAMMVQFLSSVLPCPALGADSGSGQTQPGPSASPEAAVGMEPAPAVKTEQAAAGDEGPPPTTPPPAQEYGLTLPPSVGDPARSEGSGLCEGTARIKVETPSPPRLPVAETRPGPATSEAPCSNATGNAVCASSAGPSAVHHPQVQSVQPPLSVPEATQAHLGGSGSNAEAWSVPATVAYPLYLYEGLKYNQHTESVQPGLHEAEAAMPILRGCISGSRKRAAQDEAMSPEDRVLGQERSARIASEIQIMKKRIVQHLQLNGK